MNIIAAFVIGGAIVIASTSISGALRDMEIHLHQTIKVQDEPNQPPASKAGKTT